MGDRAGPRSRARPRLRTLAGGAAGGARAYDALTARLIEQAGYALNVVRTVQAYDQAGVAGIHLKDQVSPKKCGP